MILILDIFIFDLLTEGLLLRLSLIKFFFIFFFNSIDHVLELLDMVLVCSFHFLSF
jgi:hypothetical protein